MATLIPANRAPFTVGEIAEATRGEIVGDAHARVVGVTTDSRAIAEGNLFVAIRGERFDGHAHAAQARANGAAALLVSGDVAGVPGTPVVKVPDTTLALGALARAHRLRWAKSATRLSRRVVGVTGSAGKTTTRSATSALLSALGHATHGTVGNLNNFIGAPMTLLGLAADHDVGVIEIGTSARGEIAHLASTVAPDVGVITLVAAAHTEGIGSVDDVAVEKGSLFAALTADGVAVYNADDARVTAQLERTAAKRRIGYGETSNAEVRIVERATLGVDRARVTLAVGARTVSFELPLIGRAGAYAAAAAVSVGLALGHDAPDADTLTRAFAGLGGSSGGRLAAVPLGGGSFVLDDSYNANRASMEAGIETASDIARARGLRLVLVLGDMRELGAFEQSEHAAVARRAREASPAVVVAVGAASRVIAEACADVADAVAVNDAASAIDALGARRREGDLILVKASRSIGLDELVRALLSGDSR